jgi:hypothetical protein
MKATQKKSKE